MEKIHRARKGKDWGASIYLLQKHGFPQISKCSPTRCSEHHPCSPYGGFITLTWLIKSSAPGGWTQSSDLPLFLNGLGVRWDWKFQPSGDMIGSTDNQPTSYGFLEGFQNSSHNINPGEAERVLLQNKRHSSLLWLWRYCSNWGQMTAYHN